MISYSTDDPVICRDLTRFDGRVTAMQVRGDCDFATARGFAAALRRLERRGRSIAVDMSRVTFADSVGLEPFADSVRRCRLAGRPVPRIVAASRAVSRVLEVLGVAADPFDLHAWDDSSHLKMSDPAPLGRRSEPGGGDQRRSRGTGAVTPAARAHPVATLITTAECGTLSATVQVRGILDEETAVVLSEVLLGHDRMHRTHISVDVAQVAAARPVALALLARTIDGLAAQVTMGAFSAAARDSLAAARIIV